MKQRLFAALVLLFGAACALLFLVFYRDARNAAVASLTEEQRIHARQAARGIEDFFASWTGTLAAISRMPEIVAADADGRRDIRLFYEAHREQIRSITRMDERGVILVSHPFAGVEGDDISGQRHVRELLREHRPVVSDVFRAVQGFDAVALHVPVFAGTAFKGSIAVVVNFESLAKRYLDVIRIGETGCAWVVSRDGTLLYTPVAGHTGTSAFEMFKAFPSQIAMLTDMVQGRDGAATYTSGWVRDRAVPPTRTYAVYAPIKLGNTFWSVVVASSAQELLAGLNSFRNRLALIVGAVFAGGLVFSFVAVKAWVIVREEDRRRQVEQTLRASEQKFMKAFHATPDAMVISRAADGLLLDVNEVFLRLSGYTREQTRRRTTVDLGLWADPDDRERYLGAMRAGGRVREMEARFATRGGAVLDGLVSGEPIVVDGEPCLLTIIRDITERKRTEAELARHRLHLEELVAARTAELATKTAALEAANVRLQEIDRLKSLFIASMSHELRTPLNSIIGFTGILLQGLAGPLNEEQRTQLGMVKGSSQHLLSLITDIIDLSKIEAGKLSLARERVDLVRVAREVVDSLRPAAARGGLALELAAPEALSLVSDGRRIRQVLVNLVGNAVKFTERGAVTVVVERRDGSAWVAVRDTGPGIRDEEMGRLFQFFSQVGSTGGGKPEGTGLGLYLCRKLVTLLGGEIRARSEFGRGSEFSFTLPDETPKEAA